MLKCLNSTRLNKCNKFRFLYSRHKPQNEQVHKSVQNASYGLFAHFRASFVAIRRSNQVLELDNNYKSEQGGGENEVNAYSIVDIDRKHISVNENENPSLSGPDKPSGNTKHDGYDHLGQHCIKQHNTGHTYDTFRNTCGVYDTAANISKHERTDNVYNSLQSTKEVQ